MVKNLEGGVKFLMYPRFVQVFLDKQVEGMFKHKEIYVTPSHTKKVFANMKRQGKDFSGRDTPLFPTMIVQPQEQKQSRRKQRKDTEDPQLSGPTEPITDDTKNVASVPTHSNDPLLSGEDRLKLTELMEFYTSLSQRVLDLEKTKTSQAVDITELKKRVKKLEGKRKLKPPGMKKLFKIGRSAQVVYLKMKKEVDMTKKDVSTTDPVTTASEVVTTDSITTTIVDELTLARTLIEIKVAKPKAVTTAATTTLTDVTKPRARGVIVQEPNAELEEEEKLTRQREEYANIVEWDNVQAMMDVDYELVARLQAEEQGELTIEEKSRLFVGLMNKRKKHFARLRAEKQRSKPQLRLKREIQYMDTELVKGGETKTKGSSKRAGEELESKNLKKQKLDENVEAEVDDDQEEAEMKTCMEIVPDDEVAIDAIPLATKPLIIVDWKIIKEGKMGYFQIIRADGSSKRYSSMIQMLQNIDREDLETLWKLVKAKHRLTRREEGYERVL
ncbi:hypothetical protein Tco_0504975 [Tanacetum coccineum]